jgi:hypothetical protein
MIESTLQQTRADKIGRLKVVEGRVKRCVKLRGKNFAGGQTRNKKNYR